MAYLKEKTAPFTLLFILWMSLFLSIFLFPYFSYGKQKEKVRLSETILEKETVFPIFHSKDVLKNRLIKTKGRFEIGFGTGWNMTEALYKKINFNTNLTYYINEAHAVNIAAAFIQKGWSLVGEQIYTGGALNNSEEAYNYGKPQMAKVPYKTHMIWFNYQLNPYYGKISFSKNIVAHLSLFTLAGVGAIGFSDDNYSLALNAGIGQKLHLTKRIALRFSCKFLGYFSPDITEIPKGYTLESLTSQNTPPIIPKDKYKQNLSIDSVLNINLTILI